MEMSILTDHLLITLVAWFGGLTVGGGIGYLMASFVNPLMNARPNARQIFTLVPWRTLVFMLILIVWSPLLAVWLGLGNLTGIIMVGLTVSLLACPMAMKARLYNWFPPNLRVQIISGSRTLLLFTLLATLGAGFVGGGGFGFYLMEQVNLLEYGNIVEGFLLLGAMALIFDWILGIVEYRATF